jgi:predicted ATPase
VEQTYARARTLCAQGGEPAQVCAILRGLAAYYQHRGALRTARELREQGLRLAQSADEPTHCLEAHIHLGLTLTFLGEHALARTHLEQGCALTAPREPPARVPRPSIIVPEVACLSYAVPMLWCLGYPAQALRQSQDALALAQARAHPYSLAMARHFAAFLHYLRRDAAAVQVEADALLTLATTHTFPYWTVAGRVWQGWALAMQGTGEAGVAQIRQELATTEALEQALARPVWLVLLAEAAGQSGQSAEGLGWLAEALTAFAATERGDGLAEAYRLQGVLLLRQGTPDVTQAEACFQQALTIARRQQAKSWELRAATSLAHLWQQQGKRAAAYELLAPIDGWFTEGFDTADLQKSKALLEELAG